MCARASTGSVQILLPGVIYISYPEIKPSTCIERACGQPLIQGVWCQAAISCPGTAPGRPTSRGGAVMESARLHTPGSVLCPLTGRAGLGQAWVLARWPMLCGLASFFWGGAGGMLLFISEK